MSRNGSASVSSRGRSEVGEDRAEKPSHEPTSRDTHVGMLARHQVPPACASGFRINRGGYDDHLDLGARCGDHPSRQRLQPLL